MALEMIFGNLIDNAIKYGGDQPEVLIETKVVGGDKVVTRILDNGAGVPVDLRKKIFFLFSVEEVSSNVARKEPALDSISCIRWSER